MNINGVENTTYVAGSVFHINATTNSSSMINITVNGRAFVVGNNTNIELDSSALDAGHYIVTATVYENHDYAGKSVTVEFTIVKNVADISIVGVTNVTYDVGSQFIVTVITNSTGEINLSINGKSQTVANNTPIDLGSLATGHYIITATVKDNNNFTGATTTVEFTVNKLESSLTINVTNITVVQSETIKINVTAGATGAVVITVDGFKYYVDIEDDGFATLVLSDLMNKTYTVHAEYLGNENFTGCVGDASFNVSRIPSTVTVEVDNITVGGVAVVNITVIDGATGNVTIVIGDEFNQTVGIVDGVISITVPGLTVGGKTVNVTYNGDGKFLPNGNSTTFTVGKASAGINVVVENITYGENETITIFVNATGNVTIFIDGIVNETVDIVAGKVVYPVSNLHADNYTVVVTYNGDNNTNGTSASADFTVAKADPEIGVNVTDIVYGGVESIVVSVNADGNVTIKVIGVTGDTRDLVNGNATLDVPNLAAGTYIVEVTYNGNDDYNEKTVKVDFTVAKANLTVSLEAETSIKVDETQVINITFSNANATGYVIISIAGVNHTAILIGGRANYTTDLLPAGNYTITVIYEGNDNFTGNWTLGTFEVEKLDASVSVSADATTEGQATITLSGLPSDATGYVIVDVNGTEYGINITKTKEITIPILKAGKYTVKATYLGDDRYLGAVDSTEFEAIKQTAEVEVEVDNTVAGNDVVVKVTVPEDAEGNVTVRIGNITKVVNVTGGENIITVPGVSEGTHDVEVVYSGDSHYDSKTVTTTVTVFKSINSQDKMSRGWNSPYDYQAEFLDKDGNLLKNTEVQFIVDGKTYTVKTDNQGIAYLNANLGVGSHEITSVNPATGERRNATVTIVKRLLENKDITMDFMDGTYYVVRAIGDDGNPVGEGEFVDVFINTVHYSVRTDKNGYARLKINLNPKTYTATAEYKNTKVSNKLVVKQTLKLVKKTVKVKKGKKLVLKAKLKWSNGKPIKGKKIVFKFKGKKYKAKTNSKGIAKVTIKKKVTKKLKKGKKYTYTATYFKNTVKGKVKVKK